MNPSDTARADTAAKDTVHAHVTFAPSTRGPATHLTPSPSNKPARRPCLFFPSFWLLLAALQGLALLAALLLVLMTLLVRHTGAVALSSLVLGYAATLTVYGLWTLCRNGLAAGTTLLRRSSDDAWRSVLVGLLDYEALFCLVHGLQHLLAPRTEQQTATEVQQYGRGAAVVSAVSVASVITVVVLRVTWLRSPLRYLQVVAFLLILVAGTLLAGSLFHFGYGHAFATQPPLSSHGVGLLVCAGLLKAVGLVGQEWSLARRDFQVVLTSLSCWAVVAGLIQGAVLEYKQVHEALYDARTGAYLAAIAMVILAMRSLECILLRFTSAVSVSYALLGVPIWWMLLGQAVGFGYFTTWHVFLALALSVVGYVLHQWQLDQRIGGHGECKKAWVNYYSSTTPRATGYGCHVVAQDQHSLGRRRTPTIQPQSVDNSPVQSKVAEGVDEQSVGNSPRESMSSVPDEKPDQGLLQDHP